MSIKMIAAVSKNGVIGKDGKIPFDYPEDMKFFRQMTINSTIIMGRLTYESIGRPLPKRRNIVISSSMKAIDKVEIYKSIDEAIEAVSKSIPTVAILDKDGKQILECQDNIWLVGGSSIYRDGLRHATEIYLTMIPDYVQGNNLTYFPWISPSQFKIDSLINLENSDLKVTKYIRD